MYSIHESLNLREHISDFLTILIVDFKIKLLRFPKNLIEVGSSIVCFKFSGLWKSQSAAWISELQTLRTVKFLMILVTLFYTFGFDKIRDGPDSSIAGYPVCRISGHFENGILDFRLDIRWVPDTGYFNACSLFDRVTQIIETSQIFKQE